MLALEYFIHKGTVFFAVNVYWVDFGGFRRYNIGMIEDFCKVLLHLCVNVIVEVGDSKEEVLIYNFNDLIFRRKMEKFVL